MGDTMLLATVVAAQDAKEGVDFLPLTVDYREKYAAAGRFPGGFFRREARPSETEILVMRLVDRALRPLFPDDYHAEVQVMIQLMSYDGVHNPDALCGLAASAAIAVSDIPFNGPMSEVRVGRINGEFIINPTMAEIAISDIDVMVAGTAKDVNMVEGEMQEISEAELVEVIKLAHAAIIEQCNFQLELAAEMQNMLLPKNLPNTEKIKVTALYQAHGEVVTVRIWWPAPMICLKLWPQAPSRFASIKATR
jgi:polyribonucleotide nucleotidyltransferase